MTGIRLASFILALGLSGSASAASTTWVFEGHVTLIASEPDTEIALRSLGVGDGSSFYGQLVFESETPDVDLDPSIGWYPGAISLFEITIAGYHQVVSVGSENGILMSRDGFVAGRYGFLDARASGPGPFAIFHDPLLQFVLPGRPPPFGIGEELLIYPPPLLEFDYRELFIAGIDGNIHGDLTYIDVVPEPALLAPFALAVIRRR